MNAMDFYLRSVDAQTWQDCEAEGVDPDAALAELPSPAPEAPSMIVEVAPPAILKPPPAPAVRPPQPPQSPQRRVPQSPGKAASSRRHSRVPQSPAEAAASSEGPLYEAVTFQPKHRRPTKQPIVRSRPPLRQRAYDAPHAGRAARTLTAKTKGQELVKSWPCRTPIIMEATNARREAKSAVHAPKVRIDLEWCYGFDTSIVSRNLFAIDHQRVMFACAALVVIYDTKKHTQKFFRGHGSRRVTALTVDRRIACSGDAHSKPEVLVWDVETLQVLHRLGTGFFHHHVLVLCLSPNAKALVAIDASETHNLGYWRLDDLRRLARLKKEKQDHQISAREAHAHWGGMASNDVASDDLRTKEQKPAACRRAEVHEPPAVYDGCWMFDDNEAEELDEGQHLGAGAKPQFCTVGPGVEIKFYGAFVASTSTPSARRLLDGVAIMVPHRSTGPARPRHCREMT